jgi:hypothetical protein
MGAVKGNEFADVYVGNSVPVGEAEQFSVSEVFADAQKPSTGLGKFPGISQSDAPIFFCGTVKRD